MKSDSSPAIETSGLTKAFGETRAVDGVDLAVDAGIVYGVLGPNGAGKTTLINMLSTLLPPDGGTARVFGHDVVDEARAVRRRIRLTGQVTAVDEALTGLENIILAARLIGFRPAAAKQRATELIEAFALTELSDRRLSTYSGGERRRVDIAASIVVPPDLLFLDEPTTGLDPRSRHHVWQIVRGLVANGSTVLLTTQYLDEADQLADRIALVDHGKVIAEGAPLTLKSRIGSATLRVGLAQPGQSAKAKQVIATVLGEATNIESDAAELSARVDDPEKAMSVLTELARSGVAVSDFALGQPSLDEVFLTLTGQPVVSDAAENEVRA